MIMNSVQQVTYDYIVSEYHRGMKDLVMQLSS